MHEGILIETSNVRECRGNIEALKHRPKMDMVGLGLFYGETGLGKTTFAARIACSSGHVYQRLSSTATQKSFLQGLYTALTKRYLGQSIITTGSANTLFARVCALLENHEDAVIFVDELNYAFANPRLLDTIRDIVDETLAIVILVGEDRSHEQLLKHNRRYFDRCNAIYEFKRLTRTDVRTACTELLELPFDAPVVEWVHNRNQETNFRDLMKTLRLLEEYARFQQATTITLQHCQGLAKAVEEAKHPNKSKVRKAA